MRNVLFETIKSYDDLGLFLTSEVVSPPPIKRTTISNQDMDGILDLTFGLSDKVRYGNKTITLVFVKQDYTKAWESNFSDIRNKLHGKKMRVWLKETDTHYQDAFVTVASTSADGNMGTVTITLDCYPYELKNSETTYTITATSDGTSVTCVNDEREVIPVFTSEASISVIFNDKTTNFTGAGTHETADITFDKGDNELVIKGSGAVTITYREGRL